MPDAARTGAAGSSSNITPGEVRRDGLRIKPVYSLQEFCADFGICRSRAYEEIRAGRLRAYKAGASTRIAGEDALDWRDYYRGLRRA